MITHDRVRRERTRPLQFWTEWGLFGAILLLAVGGVIVSRVWQEDKAPLLLGDLVWAPVPKTGIAAGHVIEETDVDNHHVPLGDAAEDIALSKDDLVGMLAVKNLPAGKPIPLDNVDEPVEILAPVSFVLSGTLLTSDMFTLTEVAARIVPSTTLVSPEDLTGTLAGENLPKGEPVTKEMVKSKEPELPQYVAQTKLPAFHVVISSDITCTVPVTASCVEGFNPAGQLLLKTVVEGNVVGEGDVFPQEPSIDQILELSLSAEGALFGRLQPGDKVQVILAAHVFTDTKGSPVILSPAVTESLPSFTATVLGGAPEGTGYRMTLGLNSDAKVADLMVLLPRVDLYLVLIKPDIAP